MPGRVVYLHGLGGLPSRSPMLDALEAAGFEVVAPRLPGFDGTPGWEPPSDHLGWLAATWDLLDRTGALPCPVVAASAGAMLAADLAVFRPEAVTKLALLGPLGLWDADHPGEDPFAVPSAARLGLLFAGEVPAAFPAAFDERGPTEQPVAQFIAQVAAASLIWPIADRGLRQRLHRLRAPTLVVWGEEDRIVPVATAKQWPAAELVTIPGAGHLVEWDAPDQVAAAVSAFLG